jgi:hypothetical protein
METPHSTHLRLVQRDGQTLYQRLASARGKAGPATPQGRSRHNLRLVQPDPLDLYERFAANDDEVRRQEVHAEIRDGLIYLAWGTLIALLVIVCFLYGAQS